MKKLILILGFSLILSTFTFAQKDKDKEHDDETCPIELIYFKHHNNLFTWRTASEFNNKFFILQSSQDNKIWENEEYIYSKGNSNQIIDYFLTLKPIYPYYRLVQEDWDGKFEIFSPIHINLNISEERIFDLQLNELPNNISLKPGTIYLSLKNNKWTKIMK